MIERDSIGTCQAKLKTMIDQIELRLGNFVDNPVNKKKFCEVHTISRFNNLIKLTDNPTGILYETTITQIDPIQLTPGILKTAGFQTDGNETATWHILTTDITSFIEGQKNGYCEVYLEDFDKIRVRFLHRLQNLYFSVTGKELNIKLET
jgi:hypothetical protein